MTNVDMSNVVIEPDTPGTLLNMTWLGIVHRVGEMAAADGKPWPIPKLDPYGSDYDPGYNPRTDPVYADYYPRAENEILVRNGYSPSAKRAR